MKKKSLFIILSVLLIAIALTAVASAGPPDRDSTGMYWFWQAPFSPDPVGTAKIVRTANSISGTVSTSLANDGTGEYASVAVTLWLVIFNEPGECAGAGEEPPLPCTEDDIFNNPDAKADVLYGAGHVIGGSEKANFGYSLKAGDNSTSLLGPDSYGLMDPRTAEVHYVLRSHGPIGDGPVNAMIHTFLGGCAPEDENHPPLPGFGPPADEYDLHTEAGDCQDIQYAINLAPAAP